MKKLLTIALIVAAGVFVLSAPNVLAGPLEGVPKTGQTNCYDDDGEIIDCKGTGQDGEFQKGYERFIDNDNGTVTDNFTGLMWLKDANLPSARLSWNQALRYANELNACGYDDWRLPNKSELSSLIDRTEKDPTLFEAHPFINVQSHVYWTSTTYTKAPDLAWFVSFYNGRVSYAGKGDPRSVWPVRGGH